MKNTKKIKPKTTECYAICQFYEPFVMGGDVWQWRRYKVNAEPISLDRKFKAFVYHNHITAKWCVHEAGTGGLIGTGRSRKDAIDDANNNIKITPDLEKQVLALGDTSHFEETTYEEASRRIAKSA